MPGLFLDELSMEPLSLHSTLATDLSAWSPTSSASAASSSSSPSSALPSLSDALRERRAKTSRTLSDYAFPSTPASVLLDHSAPLLRLEASAFCSGGSGAGSSASTPRRSGSESASPTRSSRHMLKPLTKPSRRTATLDALPLPLPRLLELKERP